MTYSDDCVERMASSLDDEIEDMFPDYEENPFSVEIHRDVPLPKKNDGRNTRKSAKTELPCPFTFIEKRLVPFLFLEIMFADFGVQLRTLSANRAQCFNSCASLHVRSKITNVSGLRIEVCDD